VLLALAPNMAAGEAARRLIEKAAEMDGARIGRCLVREADVDALALLDEYRDCGARLLVVASPCRGAVDVEAEAYEPLRGAGDRLDGKDTILLVRELWMNLTGSLGPDDWAAALRVLAPDPFLVLRLGQRGVERLEEIVAAICGLDYGEAGRAGREAAGAGSQDSPAGPGVDA